MPFPSSPEPEPPLLPELPLFPEPEPPLLPEPPPLLSVTSQPTESTVTPTAVAGQSSIESTTPSPSVSISQPFSSTVALVGVWAQSSSESWMPSPSVSTNGGGQPSPPSPFSTPGTPGHWSPRNPELLSPNPSSSSSTHWLSSNGEKSFRLDHPSPSRSAHP